METRSDKLLPGLTLALIALLYLLTFPQNFTEGEDAVYYVDRVSGGVAQWHPNHLIYEPLMQGLTRVAQAVWPGATALAVMQVASLIAALWTLALVWKIARLSGGGLAGASGAVWLLAGSFAFWLYGMYPDTYTLPLPFVLASFLALWQVGWDSAGSRAVIMAAFLAGIATLIHQSHVFLAVPALVVLIVARRFGAALLWLAVFGAVVGAVYLWAGWVLLGHRTIPELILWAKGYAADGLWTPLSLLAPVKALIGLGTAIWSSLFLFASPDAAGALERVFAGRQLVEETHFAATGLALGFWPLLLLTVASVLSIGGLSLRVVMRRGRALTPGFGPLLVLHAGTYAVVATIWEPTNKEFWIVTLPFLALLLVLRLPPARGFQRILVAGIVSLWLANGAGAMLGFARADSDYWQITHSALLDEVRPGDVVVDDCGYICTGYLLLFSPAELLPVDALDLAAETGPGRILLTSRAISALDARQPEAWPQTRARLQPVFATPNLSLSELPR
ncbi:hypothetical protein [Nioella aestuarii]|uniref:hypothetical protein n=1 Tax=Nioella aestuarii TaxID=1662864 RepID=UPI003D7FE862